MQCLRPIQILAAAALLLPPLAAGAATLPAFPPVTAEESAYAAVPGEPNAPAVVLSKRAELLLAGYGRLLGSFDARRLSSKAEYEAVRTLFAAAAKSDAENVVLVRR